jgi:hypothetical protein
VCNFETHPRVQKENIMKAFNSHPSQKIISNIELVWKKSYLQEIIWPDFTAVLWMDLANAQAV